MVSLPAVERSLEINLTASLSFNNQKKGAGHRPTPRNETFGNLLIASHALPDDAQYDQRHAEQHKVGRCKIGCHDATDAQNIRIERRHTFESVTCRLLVQR